MNIQSKEWALQQIRDSFRTELNSFLCECISDETTTKIMQTCHTYLGLMANTNGNSIEDVDFEISYYPSEPHSLLILGKNDVTKQLLGQ